MQRGWLRNLLVGRNRRSQRGSRLDGQPSLAARHAKIPAPTPVPETLDWDLWLGGAAWRRTRPATTRTPSRCGRRSGRPRPGAGRARRAGSPGRSEPAACGALPWGGGGGGGGEQFGFYLPFNWRGFYDFGSGLIGDWGVHIFGPANWALGLRDPISVECVKKEGTTPLHLSGEWC